MSDETPIPKKTIVKTPFYIPKSPKLPEGITYNPRNNSLFWIDIEKSEIHRIELQKQNNDDDYTEEELNTIANSHEVVKYEEEENSGLFSSIGGIGLTYDNDIIVAASKQGIAKIDFKTLTFKYIHHFDFLPEESRYLYRANDSKMSPAGNFWIGVMIDTFKHPLKNQGYLVKFDVKLNKYEVLLENCLIPNGLVWTKELDKFYHVDCKEIKVYDYDKTTDSIFNGKKFLSTEIFGEEVEFDGMTIDSENNLYIALWSGSSVVKVDQSGKVVEKFIYPVSKPTCPTIGGSHLNELFVTTANYDGEEFGGAIFRCNLDVKGRTKYIWEEKL